MLFFSLWNFAKFLMSILRAQVNFLQIFNQSSVPPNITPLYPFTSSIIYFGKKEPIKVQFLRLSSGRIKICQFWNGEVDSSSNFISFFIVKTHNSCVNFKLIHFLLWKKGSHQSPTFETFECPGEKLPNSSCHFPNRNSVFLRILHHSSVAPL